MKNTKSNFLCKYNKNNIIMKYFSLKELCHSDKAVAMGINNEPNQVVISNLEKLITNILDPLREAWGGAIKVTSGYRCATLNKAVGGSATSAHLHGLAADIVPANGKVANFKDFVVSWIKANNVAYDQYIDELSINKDGKVVEWVHIGIKSPRGEQRMQMLKCRKGKYSQL